MKKEKKIELELIKGPYPKCEFCHTYLSCENFTIDYDWTCSKCGSKYKEK